jgi:uncharacterized protein YgiM (DUF1202 family)
MKQLLLAALALAAAGCHRATGAGERSTPIVPAAQLSAGEKVQVLQDDGQFSQVRTRSGLEVYVPSGLLKHRNTSQASTDESFTHQVVQAADCFDTRPAEVTWQEPRSLEEIEAEETALNNLFLTERTHREVIAPRNSPELFVDGQTGEPCWPAFECTHPQCPGERTAGRPHPVFIHPDRDTRNYVFCPYCLALRNLKAETDADRIQWSRNVRLYELPELRRRRAELDNERRRFIRAKQQQSRPAPGSEIQDNR